MICDKNAREKGADMFTGVWLHGGVGSVSDEDQREYDAQRHAHSDGHPVVIFVENRLQDADEQHAAKSKSNRACQADVSAYVAQVSAVIPPADAPFPLKPYA